MVPLVRPLVGAMHIEAATRGHHCAAKDASFYADPDTEPETHAPSTTAGTTCTAVRTVDADERRNVQMGVPQRCVVRDGGRKAIPGSKWTKTALPN